MILVIELYMIAHIFVFQVHESKGIKFITDAGVNGFKGENGKVRIFLLFETISPFVLLFLFPQECCFQFQLIKVLAAHNVLTADTDLMTLNIFCVYS